jgi:hypothetical protein
MYSASIVSGIAARCRRVNGASGISHRPMIRDTPADVRANDTSK